MKPNRYAFAYTPLFDHMMEMVIIEAFSELEALKIGTNKALGLCEEVIATIDPNASIEDVKDYAFDLGAIVSVILIPA